MRLVEESAVVREAYPEAWVDLAVVVTELGGTTVPMFVLAMTYWLARRRESAVVVSYAVAGVALLITVKALLGLPRPPEEVYLIPLGDDPHGFPSGHAFAAVVVYGGLLSAFDLARERWAAVGAASLVASISLSRVVLGVHYLGDVIAGAALGIAFLAVMIRLTDGDPRIGFATAIVLAIPAVVVTGAGGESLLGLGGAIGGLLASRGIDDVPPLRSRLEGAILTAAGSGFVLVGVALESAVAAFAPAVVLVYAIIVGGILVAPVAIGRIERAPLGPNAS